MTQDKTPASFAALSEDRRAQAMARLAVLRPHLDDGVPLTRTAACRGRAAADGAALAHALPPGRGGRPCAPHPASMPPAVATDDDRSHDRRLADRPSFRPGSGHTPDPEDGRSAGSAPPEAAPLQVVQPRACPHR